METISDMPLVMLKIFKIWNYIHKPIITIIGWTSKFWQLWKRYFERKWLQVIVASRSTKITPEEAVKLADIIIISVGIRSTIKTVGNLIPHIPPGKLLLDFTGIKTEATRALSQYASGEVVATHPMFGPSVTEHSRSEYCFWSSMSGWKMGIPLQSLERRLSKPHRTLIQEARWTRCNRAINGTHHESYVRTYSHKTRN